jgi:AcrR family transcriptional regulator
MGSTRERIMDAAERLFAERGYDGTSLRAITAQAGANLASVNYYFNSKEALLGALFSRRLGQLNRERLRMLDELEMQAGGRAVPLPKLVRVLLEPPLRLAADPDAAGFGKLLGRMYSGSGGFPQQVFVDELRQMVERFSAAFRRTLPGLSDAERMWRMFFSIGAMAHTLAAPDLLRLVSGGSCDPLDTDTAVEMLVAFVEAGFTGPHARNARTPHHSER